jgi:protease-4
MTETPSPNHETTVEGQGKPPSRLRRTTAGLASATSSSNSSFRALGSILLWVVAPLLVGAWLAQNAIPQPAVGIIRLNTDIWAGSAQFVMMQVEEARRDPNIQAVVFQMDSPGGEVAATQTLYLELQSLRREMPVVGSIDGMAASGAYYISLATDPVYAKPSSSVGNVGVWGFIPPDVGVNEVILASGPFKLTASNRAEFLRSIEGMKLEFLETVFSQRGERLTISRADLSQGLIYPGRDSLRLGLVDHLGSQTEAVRAAAELAGIAHYEVIDLEERIIAQLTEENASLLELWVGAADPVTGRRILPPGAYLLYDIRLGGTP